MRGPIDHRGNGSNRSDGALSEVLASMASNAVIRRRIGVAALLSASILLWTPPGFVFAVLILLAVPLAYLEVRSVRRTQPAALLRSVLGI